MSKAAFMPSTQGIQNIIDLLTPYGDIGGDRINMKTAYVSKPNDPCNLRYPGGVQLGTSHCALGWLTVALVKAGKLVDSGYLTFGDGADYMAAQLGFKVSATWENDKTRARIIDWGIQNRSLWGAGDPSAMFISKRAYYDPDKRPEGLRTMQDFIDQWAEVKQRIEALQQLNSERPATARAREIFYQCIGKTPSQPSTAPTPETNHEIAIQ